MKLYYIAVYMLACSLSNSRWNIALAIHSDLLSGGSLFPENEDANISQTFSGQGTDTHLADNGQETQSSSVKAIELDINTTVSTDTFDFETSGDVKSFTPKHGCAFSKVVEIEANSSQTKELYQTSDTRKFVSKVEYNTNNHEVVLHIGNETYKLEKVSLEGDSGKHVWVNQSSEVQEKEDVEQIEDVGNNIEKMLEELKREYRKVNELDRVKNDLQRQLEGAEQLEDEINHVLSKEHQRSQLRNFKTSLEKEKEGIKKAQNKASKLNQFGEDVIQKEMVWVKKADKTVKEWDQVAGLNNDVFNAGTDKWEEDKFQDIQSEVDELKKQSVNKVHNEMKEIRKSLGSVEMRLDNIKSEIVSKMEREELEKLKEATRKTHDEIKDIVKENEFKKKMEQADIDKEVDELAKCIVETKETDAENKEKEPSVLNESEDLNLEELEQWKRELAQELKRVQDELETLEKVSKLDFEEFKEFISEFERELELAMYDMDEMNELENVGNIESLVDLKKLKEATIILEDENKNVEKEVKEIEKVGNTMNPAELEELKTDLEEELKWVTEDVTKVIEKARNDDEVKERVKNVQKQKADELKKLIKEVDLQLEDRKKVQKEIEEKDLAKVLYEQTKDLKDDSECEQEGNDLKVSSENQQQSNPSEKKSESQDQPKENDNNEQSSVWLT